MGAPTTSPADREQRWLAVLSPEERRELLEVDDRHGWMSLALNWGLVFAAFALVAFAPGLLGKALASVVALFVIGARQLGFAILMHEAAHRSLFGTRALNDALGNWLAAYPIWAEVEPYRRNHLLHHAHTGTARDPDLGLVAPFPVTRASLRRKLIRDLTGQTGWKQARATLRRSLGEGGPKLAPVALTNGVLLAVLALAGQPALYLLWVGAWLTTYRLVTRIRSIAEHALTPDPSDPLNQTRTTLARAWERLLIAPNRVNFHLEHHLMMTVPHHKLPRLHRLLCERGVLDRACIAGGYLAVLRTAASRAG